MKIAIISDTHDNLTNIKKVVDWLNKEKINLLLHCGDINSQEATDEIKNNFKGEVKFVRGNADHNLKDLPEKIEFEFGGKRISFTHYPGTAKELAQTAKYDLVFYGHTHRPWEERTGDCRMINPGEAAGQIYKPTFAIYDTNTDRLELKILEKLE
ncbi:metallophosphatase family protein [Patescibacteria group bacterium]|nr:metallophosphatase family protein [Patescibacteria group bacterium]MBU4367656.1 metallophosphatase family protein [Patescibacteria group bacterium]MBU4461894.1 metallophosphatase family protein [Patescibacteria group bacterium]MCG2699975.1 metallophosphatase family protein [Candidatus Parcubacteria bacterium]